MSVSQPRDRCSEVLNRGPQGNPRVARLCLGRIPADFIVGHDIAAGPWCLVGTDWQLADARIEFADGFATVEETYRAGEAVGALCDQFISRLGREMDIEHSEQHPFSYWQVLLLPWTYRLAEAAYVRFVQINRLVDFYRDSTVEVELAKLEGGWNFENLIDFALRGLAHPDFHFWLTSEIVRVLSPPAWKLIEVPFAPPTAARRRIQAAPRFATLRRMARALMPRLRFDNVWGVGPIGRFLFSIYLQAIPARPYARQDLIPAPMAAGLLFPANFLSLLNGLLAATRPSSLGGDYQTYASEAKKRRYKPGRVQVGALTWINENELFIAAHAIEAGEKVIGDQYGSNYGWGLIFSFPARLQYRLYAFLTWGWTAQEDYPGRFIPAPSPRLSRLADRHRMPGDGLILAGTSLHFVLARLHTGPQAGQATRYRGTKKSFLLALEPDVRAHVRYRPHHLGDWDFPDLDYVRRFLPGVPEVKGDQFEFADKILDCRLLVLDHPGTTMHISLAANVPTVIFFERDAWQVCRQAKPIFAALEDARILFHDPEAAAEHVNRIWPDVEAWWSTPEVQEARRRFCAEHARTSRTWWWDWIRILWRLSRER